MNKVWTYFVRATLPFDMYQVSTEEEEEQKYSTSIHLHYYYKIYFNVSIYQFVCTQHL